MNNLINLIEETIKSKEQSENENFGLSKALEILKSRDSNFENHSIESLGTIQSRAIALSACDALKGRRFAISALVNHCCSSIEEIIESISTKVTIPNYVICYKKNIDKTNNFIIDYYLL